MVASMWRWLHLFANERYEKILKILNQKASVTVSELMKLFGVSIETVRRDLEYLEQQNALTRVHGGAISCKKVDSFFSLCTRITEHKQQKLRLSKTACKFIKENDVIAIDSGSTAMELAAAIKQVFNHLTVVTNSPEVLNFLSEKESFTLIQTGGQYLKEEQAFYGHITQDAIRHLHFQKAFIFPSAISLQQGAGVFVHDLVDVQKAYMQNADEVFILADSSKFETSAVIKLCDLFSYHLITDDELSDEIYNIYKDNHIDIIR
jgi:DeoR/GlpR family transcriptional regulator of sugar metabolism